MTYLYDEFLDKSGVEDRKGQRDALKLLEQLSDGDPENFAIQAPTGTGKSFAALLAGVYNARAERRTVIGTSTLVLSDQYATDMSVLAGWFPDVKFFVLKGASNYYCGNKAAEEMRRARGARALEMKKELAYAARTGTSLPFWAVADTEYCSDCAAQYMRKKATSCEYARARLEALRADVLVTTHAMINIDTRMRAGDEDGKGSGGILGDIWLTVFDEAHKAANSLVYSEVFTKSRLRSLDFNGVLEAMSFERRAAFSDHMDSLEGSEWRWYSPSAKMAQKVLHLWPNRAELSGMLSRVRMCAEKDRPDLYRNVRFLQKARVVLEELAAGGASGGVALYSDGRKYKMQDMIPEARVVEQLEKRRVAWMSATIGTTGKPLYSLTKCGIKATLFNLESPFDFGRQLRWAVRCESAVTSQGALLNGVNSYLPGGMVVLTPSHWRKERIAESVSGFVQVQAQPVQGDNGNRTNVATMKAHKDAADSGDRPVMVGVEVFSTGVDLPGSWLTKLVIAGLFPLREDAAYANWRWRWLESVGGRGFEDFELPERAIALEQQIGRLIRRETDEGIVVFYIEDKDWAADSKGRRVIEEALSRFPGAKELG